MNSYFASVEQQANPFLRGKAIAITGKNFNGQEQTRSVVTTASIEAKKLGVKTAMSTWEAKRICPSLILYPGDPEKYSAIMHRFNGIFRDFTHIVDQFSVDESFLDVTEVAGDYLGASFIAQAIRTRLLEDCGERITASIGVAPNKLMAKLAGESVKPNGLTVIKPENIIRFIDTRELQDLCGIGHRIEARLNNLGIYTFQQLREFPLDRLEKEFKSYGIWLHEAAHGRDSSAVSAAIQTGVVGSKTTQERADDPKSVGHSYTLPQNSYDPVEIQRYLLRLCDAVGWRLRRDGFVARRVSAYVRYGDFSSAGQQHVFKEPTADGFNIFKNAWRILQNLPSFPRGDTGGFGMKPIRLVGVSASHLSDGPAQPSLFKKDRKLAAAIDALDLIQHRYGRGVWTRASLVNTQIKNRSSGFHFDHEI